VCKTHYEKEPTKDVGVACNNPGKSFSQVGDKPIFNNPKISALPKHTAFSISDANPKPAKAIQDVWNVLTHLPMETDIDNLMKPNQNAFIQKNDWPKESQKKIDSN